VTTPVYLEVGSKRVFACSLDWPGWCRSGKTEEAALDALSAYAPRYAPVAAEAGRRFPKSPAGLRHRQPDADDRDAVQAVRASVDAAIRQARAEPEKAWPYRYAARRFAWHVLDHAWEIEDRSDSPDSQG
jgi:hypothetical protein